MAVSDWFCPTTVSNLRENPLITLVAWEPAADHGYQILGARGGMQDLEMLDGYSPEMEKKAPPPQVDRELLVQVDRVVDFKITPHSDVEE